MKRLIYRSSMLLAALGALLLPQSTYACSSGGNAYIAGMCVFGGNFAPRGFAFANGQLLSISSYTAVFAIMGTTYGGDGRTTFGLPDMRGRVAVGAGNGPGLQNYALGQKGGVERVVLLVTQMPTHTHSASTTVDGSIDNTAINAASSISLKGVAMTATTTDPSGAALANIRARRSGYYTTTAPDVVMANEAVTIDVSVANTDASAVTAVFNTGGNQSHENRMPYLVMNWIVALEGVFPSRN